MTFDKSQLSYRAFRNIVAERTNGVVFWIGSGPSTAAGLPTWSSLKGQLLKALSEKIDHLDQQEVELSRESVKAINAEQNNWVAFERLRTELGQTTWQECIREFLGQSASIESPEAYQKIWSLRPHGILTLNLDRLASRAYVESNKEAGLLTEFVGRQIADYTHALRNPHPFVCHLHGKLEDVSSWVMTSSQLKRAKNNPAYRNFINTCLTAKTVVFVGISTDDIAVGGFIEELSRFGIDAGAHYWITDRRDNLTDRWAEKQGIRLIRYDAPDNNHSELLELLDDLRTYVSQDDPADLFPLSPVGFSPATHSVPPQEELLKLSDEEIRQILNEEASRILEVVSPETTKEYEQFSIQYDQAIYRAWYTSSQSGSNQLLGNTLHEVTASGAFGKVYRATDAEGYDVAVKVLHEGMRQNSDLFQAFRRGVRSMQILGHNHVAGMVPYRKASEIPACIVMDWVDGPSLDKAVSSKQVRDWESVLRIGSGIAEIVRRGHVLPERVLHRDIRPSNVMLRGFYSDPYDWEVVVLDFDLSWHRGALEKSVVHGSTTFGYLAPEQIHDIAGVSTRHAAVDSFGMGMVLFFMMSGRDPVPNEHKHTDWKITLREAVEQLPCSEWHSIPSRFARLIEYATQDKQAGRWDMTQIEAELKRLHQALLNPDSIQSIELVAEEIAARSEFSKDYRWDGDTLSAAKDTASGVKVQIQGDESERRILAKLSWGEPGVQGQAFLDKWIPRRMETTRDMLANRGWRIEESQARYAYISVRASLPIGIALRDIDETAASLDRALNQLRF